MVLVQCGMVLVQYGMVLVVLWFLCCAIAYCLEYILCICTLPHAIMNYTA